MSTASQEVEDAFKEATDHVKRMTPPHGVLLRDDEPDIRWVTVNANVKALTTALRALARRIDELQGAEN